MKTLLRIVLIVVGLALLISSVWLLVWPWEKLASSAQERFGLVVPSAVESPITVYIFRAMCITYAWAGILFLIGAADPLKYLALIRTLALTSVSIGLVCLLVGVNVGLPIKPVLFCDVIPSLVAGVLILALSGGINQEPAKAAPPTQGAA